MTKPKPPRPGVKKHAVPGNQNGLKLKEAEVRQEAFKAYCDHLASGYPKQAFFFSHPTHSVCWKTMEKYIEENPTEFPAIKVKEAKSLRMRAWMDKGLNMVHGKVRGSPVVWANCMRNIFRSEGWDQDQVNETHRPDVAKFTRFIRREPITETDSSNSELE